MTNHCVFSKNYVSLSNNSEEIINIIKSRSGPEFDLIYRIQCRSSSWRISIYPDLSFRFINEARQEIRVSKEEFLAYLSKDDLAFILFHPEILTKCEFYE